VRARVTGKKELSAKLAALGVDVEKNLERAAVAGALPFQNRAKVNAPWLTGNLRRSIHIGGHEDRAPDFVDIEHRGSQHVPEPEVSADRVTVYVGTDVEYAPSAEFGDEQTRRRPHPFMRPAFDEGQREAVEEVGAAFAALVRAAAE